MTREGQADDPCGYESQRGNDLNDAPIDRAHKRRPERHYGNGGQHDTEDKRHHIDPSHRRTTILPLSTDKSRVSTGVAVPVPSGSTVSCSSLPAATTVSKTWTMPESIA